MYYVCMVRYVVKMVATKVLQRGQNNGIDFIAAVAPAGKPGRAICVVARMHARRGLILAPRCHKTPVFLLFVLFACMCRQ